MWMGLNRFAHEGMNDISNIKVHLKTRSRNVNMIVYGLCNSLVRQFLVKHSFTLLRQLL